MPSLSALFRQIASGGTPPPRWATPGELAKLLNPKTVQTEALDLIDKALVEAFNTPDARLIISMPPQEGKSTRVGVFFPLWVLTQRPSTRIVMTSFSDRLAKRNSRDVRNLVTSDGDRLGLALSHDVANQNEWQLAKDRGGMFAVSVGGALTGTPADLLIIDDPHKGAKEADSETQREDVWEWWSSTASTRLAPGAPVVMILTRWHEDDLAGKFLGAEDGGLWTYINIPAQADHDPAKGETDPLGREPGQWLNSARRNKKGEPRSAAAWEAVKKRVTARTWNALYQGRPSATEGSTFKRAWWHRYDAPMWTVEPDGTHRVPEGSGTVILSWDMTFKETKGSDYVVGQVWLHRGADAFLLDQVRKRMGFSETVKAFQAQAAKWPQATVKLVEDKANGTAVIDTLKNKISGIIPVTPHESKTARAEAVTPFIEAHNVHLPSFLPFTEDLIEEAASFPTGAHDDQVDATTQALNRIFIRGGRAQSWLDFYREQAGTT